MEVSQKGIDLIVHFEGLVPYAYNDPAGHATFGVGHLLHRGRCTQEDYRKWGSRQNPKPGAHERALRVLRLDLKRFEGHVTKIVRGDTLQREFDAMVSLAFNIGLAGFEDSTVRREHNRRHPFRAALAFTRWVFASGVPLPGLIRRRTAERRMYRGRSWR